METSPLQAVSDAATQAASAREQLYAAIRAAVAGPHSLRVVGAAAGMSHEQVRRIVQGAQ